MPQTMTRRGACEKRRSLGMFRRVVWRDTGWSDFTFFLFKVNVRIARNVLQRDWTLIDIRAW